MNEKFEYDLLAPAKGIRNACILAIPFWMVVCACLVILLKVMK